MVVSISTKYLTADSDLSTHILHKLAEKSLTVNFQANVYTQNYYLVGVVSGNYFHAEFIMPKLDKKTDYLADWSLSSAELKTNYLFFPLGSCAKSTDYRGLMAIPVTKLFILEPDSPIDFDGISKLPSDLPDLQTNSETFLQQYITNASTYYQPVNQVIGNSILQGVLIDYTNILKNQEVLDYIYKTHNLMYSYLKNPKAKSIQTILLSKLHKYNGVTLGSEIITNLVRHCTDLPLVRIVGHVHNDTMENYHLMGQATTQDVNTKGVHIKKSLHISNQGSILQRQLCDSPVYSSNGHLDLTGYLYTYGTLTNFYTVSARKI